MKKRFLPILFALALCLTLLPTVALADGDGVTTADDLIAAVTSDGTITLGADITLSGTLTISSTVTLDLNGHTLTGANGSQDALGNCGDGGTAITVTSGGDLTITSSGSIVGGNGGTAITVKDGGSLTVSGGEILGGNGGSGGNGGDGGSAISMEGGSLTITGSGSISGGNGGNGNWNAADDKGSKGGNGGSAIHITGGTVTVGGSGTISGGNAGSGGAAGSYGSDGSNGDPGKAILTSGEGSIGVSSAAALKTAVEAGVSKIKLTGNIELTETLNVTKDLTLDLNGHKLEANKGVMIGVINGDGTFGTAASLTIDDSSTDGKGKLTATGLNLHEDPGVNDLYLNYGIRANGNLTVNGGTVSATGADNRPNKDGSVTSYGIFVNGTLTVNGGNVTGTGGYVGLSDTAEGTLYDAGSFGIVANHISVTGGSVTGNGGTANGKSSTSNGIEAQLGSLTVTGGTVKGTYAPAAYFTKAIYANQVTLLSISGGTFNGALVVYLHSGGCTSSLSGGTFNDGITVWNTTPQLPAGGGLLLSGERHHHGRSRCDNAGRQRQPRRGGEGDNHGFHRRRFD